MKFLVFFLSLIVFGFSGHLEGSINNRFTGVGVGLKLGHCTVDTLGKVRCWGKLSPKEIPADLGYVHQVVVGLEAACAIHSPNRKVKCWGYLGDPKNFRPYDLTAPADLKDIVQIGLGSHHACSLNVEGKVRCWGEGSAAKVPANLAPARMLAASRYHSCAIVADNGVVCWGDNSVGQTDAPKNLKAESISIGSANGCSVSFEGDVTCWGAEKSSGLLVDKGQTGVPTELEAVKKVVVGDTHACALTQSNSLQCWGGSDPRGKPPEETVRDVFANGAYTCAILKDNSLKCWSHVGVSSAKANITFASPADVE
jgi:hypothetical protein